MDSLDPQFAFWFMAIMLGFSGGAIGSFMNVVVHRLPAGKSLVHPGSQCPACGHDIRSYHNIPVLSWFWLRGRCFDCGAKFSFRYPLVEGVTASLFIVLAVVELFSVGTNLPVRTLDDFKIVDKMILENALPLSMAALGVLYFCHLMLLCTLLCAALIEYDGNRVPMRLFVPALLVGLLPPILWPELRPVPAWNPVPAWYLESHWLAGLVDGVAGMAAGMLAGAAIAISQRNKPTCFTALLTFALTGIYLGLQAATILAAWTAVLLLLATLLALVCRFKRPLGVSSLLFLCVLGWIPFWKTLANWSLLEKWCPNVIGKTNLEALGFVLATAFVFSILTRMISLTKKSSSVGKKP